MGEDDAVPGLVGRGHSSAALHREKGQLRPGQAASFHYLGTEMRRRLWIKLSLSGSDETVRGSADCRDAVDWSAADPCRLQAAFIGLQGRKLQHYISHSQWQIELCTFYFCIVFNYHFSPR